MSRPGLSSELRSIRRWIDGTAYTTLIVIAAVFVIALVGCDATPPAPPAPTAWVTDNLSKKPPESVKGMSAEQIGREFEAVRGDGFMSQGAREAVDAQLQAYEARTGHQVIVWIDRRLPKGSSAEAFGLLAFNAWGIGRTGHDDGAVLFLFVEDRALRIQVGYGLERALSDRVCARIIRDVIVPQVQKGNQDAAIIDGVAAILAAIEGNHGVSVEEKKP